MNQSLNNTHLCDYSHADGNTRAPVTLDGCRVVTIGDAVPFTPPELQVKSHRDMLGEVLLHCQRCGTASNGFTVRCEWCGAELC